MRTNDRLLENGCSTRRISDFLSIHCAANYAPIWYVLTTILPALDDSMDCRIFGTPSRNVYVAPLTSLFTSSPQPDYLAKLWTRTKCPSCDEIGGLQDIIKVEEANGEVLLVDFLRCQDVFVAVQQSS